MTTPPKSLAELLRQVTPMEIIANGHLVYMALDGQAVDVEVKTPADFEFCRVCPECGAEMLMTEVWWPKGTFIAARCDTPACRTRREDAQVRRANDLRRGHEQEKADREDAVKRFGVPSGYYHCALSNFENHEGFKEAKKIANDAYSFAHNSVQTLFIYGDTGTGKSHLAVAIIREYAKSGAQSILFESVARLMTRVRDTYRGGAESETEREVINAYSVPRLLALDDLGVENITPNSAAVIQQVVENRLNRMELKTVLTSNFKIEKIKKVYGDRLASRLSAGALIHIIAPDYRRALI